MLNFRFQNQTEIIFGKDTEKSVGEEVVRYSNKVLICSYGQEFEQGLLDVIKASLKSQGVEHFELQGIKPNPEVAKVYEGIELVRQNDIGFVLAVGGGSVIDTAKAIGVGAKYDGDVWELYFGKPFSDTLPTGVVLTFPATGSETSGASMMTNGKKGDKMGVVDNRLRPAFAILNPELTFTLPPYQTFCGIVDIMSHVMERYFSNTKNVDLTDRLCEAVLKTVIRNALILLESPKDYNARAEIMWCSTVAHNDLLGTGRTQDWASHTIGHQLSAEYDSTHGATLSVITPAWAKYVYKNNVERFCQFAMRVFDVEYDFDDKERTALEGIYRLEKFFKRIGVPTTLSELGIETDDKFKEMSEKARGPMGRPGDIKQLDPSDICNILELAK